MSLKSRGIGVEAKEALLDQAVDENEVEYELFQYLFSALSNSVHNPNMNE